MEAFMSIQKKILPFLSILILTQNHGLAANWWDKATTAATGAWNDNKGKIQDLIAPGTQALQAAASGVIQGGNLNNFQQDAQAGFQSGQAQPEALKKATAFYALPTTTFAQKTAIQTLYQGQKYKEIVTIVDQTGEIFTMLARTPDTVKKTNESNLAQMSQAFNNITSDNIVSVTNSVYTFVKGIAPAAPAGSSTGSISDADFEKKVLAVVEKKYGPLLEQLQTMVEESTSQTNIFATQKQPANNMFMSSGD